MENVTADELREMYVEINVLDQGRIRVPQLLGKVSQTKLFVGMRIHNFD